MSETTIDQEACYTVRSLERRDIAEVLRLQRRAGALYAPWSEGQLVSHLRNFPAGQHVVVGPSGAIVGVCSTLRLAIAPDEVPGDWRLVTGNGYFHTHEPSGTTLYLVDVSIDPAEDRAAVRQALDAALMAWCREAGVERLLSPCRLPGFSSHARAMTPEDYMRDVAAGRLPEPVVGELVSQGFRLLGLLPDLQNEPRPADKLAMLLEWQAGAA